MNPDSMETRVGRLEQAVAGMTQQIKDQSRDIQSLMPLAVAFGRFELVVERLQADQSSTLQMVKDNHRETRQLVHEIVDRMDEDAKDRQRGQAERAKEDRSRKTVLIVGFLAAGAALLSALVGFASVFFQ